MAYNMTEEILRMYEAASRRVQESRGILRKAVSAIANAKGKYDSGEIAAEIAIREIRDSSNSGIGPVEMEEWEREITFARKYRMVI